MNVTADRRRYFESLDLVRGLAALAVLIYHVDFMFGIRHLLLPGGYLAVDLFFVLSGFVLSLNYGDKIMQRSISLRTYGVARIARLYPLFFATTAIGFVVMTGRHSVNYGYIDAPALIKSALLNIVMLPSFAGAYGMSTLFLFNPASWSIFFEVVASFLFFFYLGRVGKGPLVLIGALAGMVLVATIVLVGTVDLGYSTDNIWAGFPRVIFSFTVGVLIQRAFARKPWRCPTALFYGMIVAVFGMMQLRLLLPAAPFDIVAVGLVLPALVIVSAGVSLAGLPRKIATFFGEISYSVYLTQGPLIIIAAGLAQTLAGEKIYDLGPWVGFVFVTCAIILSYLTYRFFEFPARSLLRQFGRGKKLPVADGVPPRL